MNIVVEKLPNCAASLRVEIPAETVSKERDTIVRTYSSKARIPGFRPGKAPRAVVEKRYAKEIEGELVEKLVDDALRDALKQETLKVLDFGTVKDLTFGAEGSCSFNTTLTLAPEITLPEYKGIPVTAPPAAVPDEDLAKQLESLRERFADFTAIEDRAAAIDDFAVIDYTSTVNGQPTDEFLGKSAGYLSGREGFWVRLNDQFFLPGFAGQAVGMNVGESREIPISLPEDYPVAGLANQTLVLATTLKELKLSVLPELNDEFANRLAPGKTMEEVTTMIRENLAYERERKISDHKVNQIIEHLTTQVDCELPENLLTQETQSQADSMVERGVRAGMSEEEIQEQQNEIFAAAGQQAVSNLRTNFILREIAAAEQLAIEDKELVSHLIQIATSRKIEPRKFIKDMQRQGRIEGVRQSMLIGKTLDFLLEHATVTEDPAAELTA
jgi:trigger factor